MKSVDPIYNLGDTFWPLTRPMSANSGTPRQLQNVPLPRVNPFPKTLIPPPLLYKTTTDNLRPLSSHRVYFPFISV
jgi:hypothetical protein